MIAVSPFDFVDQTMLFEQSQQAADLGGLPTLVLFRAGVGVQQEAQVPTCERQKSRYEIGCVRMRRVEITYFPRIEGACHGAYELRFAGVE